MLVIIYAWLEEVLWSLVKQYNVAPLPSTLENDNIIIIYWQNVIVLKYHSENLNLGNKKPPWTIMTNYSVSTES